MRIVAGRDISIAAMPGWRGPSLPPRSPRSADDDDAGDAWRGALTRGFHPMRGRFVDILV